MAKFHVQYGNFKIEIGVFLENTKVKIKSIWRPLGVERAILKLFQLVKFQSQIWKFYKSSCIPPPKKKRKLLSTSTACGKFSKDILPKYGNFEKKILHYTLVSPIALTVEPKPLYLFTSIMACWYGISMRVHNFCNFQILPRLNSRTFIGKSSMTSS